MNQTGSRDEYLQRLESAAAIDAVIRTQRVFERANKYLKSLGEPKQIITPRLITTQIVRLSAETMQECAEIRTRQDRRNVAATIELEQTTEGHLRASDAELHE